MHKEVACRQKDEQAYHFNTVTNTGEGIRPIPPSWTADVVLTVAVRPEGVTT